MFDYDFEVQAPSNFRIFGHDATVQYNYESYFHRLDPGREVAMRSGVGEWFADEQMLDVRAPQQQEYVHDFSVPSGFGAIAPHLRRITQMHSRIESLSAGLALARASLDRLPFGVLAVDKPRHVLLVAAHAVGTLATCHELRITQQRLVCKLPWFDEALGGAVASACCPARHRWLPMRNSPGSAKNKTRA